MIDRMSNLIETLHLIAHADLTRYTIRLYEDLSAVLILIGA